ncbi:MAG: MAPEG family protein [Proteobacteria bacterium]|nr:MAPEG family protein [Pseudomonadota bacterium]
MNFTLLHLTPLYACILAVWLVILSVRVIALRGNPAFAFFAFGKSSQMLERAVRGHGNLTEYAPTFLILLLLAEVNGVDGQWLHIWAGLFVLGRLLHGIGFGFMLQSLPLRIAGTVLTLTPMLALIVMNALRLM